MAFVGIWGLLLNLGQPFYPVFLVQGLHRPVGDVGLLTALAGVGGILTLRGWGWLCERFGNKPVLYVCSIVWALVGLGSWAMAGERFFWHLALSYLVIGGTTAGFQLCQFHLMLKLAPANKAPYVAVFLALTSLLTAIGPLLGGVILRLLPDELGTFLGQTIRDYHVLILSSMLGCLLSTHLLDFVREEQAHPTEEVWRTMRRMRPFNPLLTMTTAAEMFLTPGGLLGLTRQSVRVLRRQAKVLTDVGEHIVEGTAEAIRSTLPSDDDTDELPQTSRGGPRPGYDPTLFLYEHVPGGTGLSERIHQNRKTLLFRAERLIAGCPCDLGCPACVGPSDQGPRKSTALFLLGAMLAAVVDEG